MTHPLLRPIALGAAAVVLSGCISLLPKSKPAQLFRFGPQPAATARPAPPADRPAIFLANGSFQAEASDDRILTLAGGQAAYIAQSRWVAPANVLFREAVVQAFGVSPVRLVARGQQGRFAYALRFDVRNFETRYVSGRGTAPLIVVRVHAALNRADQSNVGEQDFEVSAKADSNRVGAIVEAYDKAVGEVLGQLVAWTEAKAT